MHKILATYVLGNTSTKAHSIERLLQKALAVPCLTASAPESLCRGRLRRQLEYFPNLLHPLERLRIVAQAQTHHTVIPVHSPGYMNEQQPKALQARGSFLLIQAQPFNGTDYIIGQ